MPTRRFPVPWTFEEHNGACFIVKDANGLAVAYYEEQPGRRTTANLMTKDEARRIAGNQVLAAKSAAFSKHLRTPSSGALALRPVCASE